MAPRGRAATVSPRCIGRARQLGRGHGVMQMIGLLPHQPVNRRQVMRGLRIGGGAGIMRLQLVRTGDQHDVFGLLVIRDQIVIADRPVHAGARQRMDAEIVGMQPRGQRPPAIAAAAQPDRIGPFLVEFADIAIGAVIVDRRVLQMVKLPLVGVVAALFHDQHALVGLGFQKFLQEKQRPHARADSDDVPRFGCRFFRADEFHRRSPHWIYGPKSLLPVATRLRAFPVPALYSMPCSGQPACAGLSCRSLFCRSATSDEKTRMPSSGFSPMS
jgi:hypothetical protein